MNGPQHYREAERKLAQAHTQPDADYARELTAEAQVHAFLALAAAAADGEPAWDAVLNPKPETFDEDEQPDADAPATDEPEVERILAEIDAEHRDGGAR